MKTYLLLFNLCIISVVQAQMKLEQENSIIFSGFEEYGYTLTVYIKDSIHVETKLSGKCKITNNTEDTIIRYIQAMTPKTTVQINKKVEILPQDTVVFTFNMYYPFEKTRPVDMPIIKNVLEPQTYDIWDKYSLFDYLKKSDRYYRIGLKVHYERGDITNSFLVDFKIPVNSIKEIIWIDDRKK